MTISDAKRNQKRPHRLTARTAGSHPANRSSILREVTNTKSAIKALLVFVTSRARVWDTLA